MSNFGQDLDDSARIQAAARLVGQAGGADAPYQSERELIWAAGEGQVVNFWIYLMAIGLCWLVIPVFWALYRYLSTAKHRYELTDQRLLEHSGIMIHHMDSLELYRVIDIRVDGTFIQSLFGRGRVVLLTHDLSSPRLTINAIASPAAVADLIRDAVERCRVAKGVRAVDV